MIYSCVVVSLFVWCGLIHDYSHFIRWKSTEKIDSKYTDVYRDINKTAINRS
jgi:hypothetical protein